MTTDELNTICHDYITGVQDAIPAPLNYRGFPKSVCTSVNNVICHGIPGPKKLKNGDVINIDITVIKAGYHGDTSKMFFIGKPSIQASRLCAVAHDAMQIGIQMVKPGVQLGDIGHACQSHAEKNRFSVVRDFCGHGLGRIFHTAPSILHYGKPGKGTVLREGMFFTIEPMINAGRFEVKVLEDGWTAVTRDKSLSAQFEHSIAVTAEGYEIFTLSPKGWTAPPYADSEST